MTYVPELSDNNKLFLLTFTKSICLPKEYVSSCFTIVGNLYISHLGKGFNCDAIEILNMWGDFEFKSQLKHKEEKRHLELTEYYPSSTHSMLFFFSSLEA